MNSTYKISLISFFLLCGCPIVQSIYFATDFVPPPDFAYGTIEHATWRDGFIVRWKYTGIVGESRPVVEELSRESIRALMAIIHLASHFNGATGTYEFRLQRDRIKQLESFGDSPSQTAFDQVFQLVKSPDDWRSSWETRDDRCLIYVHQVSIGSGPNFLAQIRSRWKHEQWISTLRFILKAWLLPVFFSLVLVMSLFWFLSLQKNVLTGTRNPLFVLFPLLVQIAVFLLYFPMAYNSFGEYTLTWKIRGGTVLCISLLLWVLEFPRLFRLSPVSTLILVFMGFVIASAYAFLRIPERNYLMGLANWMLAFSLLGLALEAQIKRRRAQH